MNIFLLVSLLALPCAAAETPHLATSTTAPLPTPPPGTLDSSKIRLDAHDVTGALADAEAVLAKGGGADAYIARADAKRALGRPMEEVLADYSQAAKLDPRYLEKYNGLITQIESEKHPQKTTGGSGLGGVPVGFVLLGMVVGIICITGGVMLTRERGEKPAAPNDESIKSDGKKEAPDAKATPDDPDKPKKDIS